MTKIIVAICKFALRTRQKYQVPNLQHHFKSRLFTKHANKVNISVFCEVEQLCMTVAKLQSVLFESQTLMSSSVLPVSQRSLFLTIPSPFKITAL